MGQASRGTGLNQLWSRVTLHEEKWNFKLTLIFTNPENCKNVKNGFGDTKTEWRTARYWISCYEKGNEDEPISCHRAEIMYKPGQSKQQKMLAYCHDIFRYSPPVWEVLVHQGPSEIPESGDQVIARLSRKKFDGCEELTI